MAEDNIFGEYRKEDLPHREDVSDQPVTSTAGFVKVFKTCLDELLDKEDTKFEHVADYFKNVTPRKVDIEAIVKKDNYFYDNNAGWALSAAINNSVDTEFQLSRAPGRIGYKLNGKKLSIQGDVEGSVGTLMEDGKIDVYGNADIVGNRMAAGNIIIHGDVTDSIGEEMTDGEIVVTGNSKTTKIGKNMKRGIISIEGNLDIGSQYYSDRIGYGMRSGVIKINGCVNDQRQITDRSMKYGGRIIYHVMEYQNKVQKSV